MLILPLEKSIDWHRPPLVTILLIVINTLILLFAPDGSETHDGLIQHYGFIPAEHRPITFLTHTFLHGSLGHLVGNMIFLFLMGFAVETTLGSGLYLLFYLIAGQCAVLLFWLLNANSPIPLVGASGCIAGLMGLYSALFGLRRIRFFYSLLFYFGYASAPAIILLPIWVLNELYQLLSGEDSHIAYIAHVGGLLGGGLLGLGIKRFGGKVDTAYLDESARSQTRNLRFQEGIDQLKALDIEKAYGTFQTLLEADPQDGEALLQLYKVAKFKPQSPRYREVAERLLNSPPDPHIAVKDLHEAFADYRRSCSSPLPPDLIAALAKRFCRGGFTDTAETLAQELLADGREEAADLLLFLAANLTDRDEQRRYLHLILEKYPHHEATVMARQLLNG
ncbi:MAG: rhomboid family intramembrane serine protease [Methylococcaceae bacterium]|nr:rhomboid family intramembrane serine protease [Methylococcaceae bacterium]